MGWFWEYSSGWLIFFFLFGVPCSKGTLEAKISYDCGQYGMQLVVVPWGLPNVLFKVFDEFGNPFEVRDCSECHHFLSRPDNATFVFSTGYHGCHVLQKGHTFHLNVLVELVRVSWEVNYAKNVSMVCPKPDPVSKKDPTPLVLQKTTKPSTDLYVTTKPVSSPPSIKLQKTTKPSTDLHATTKPVSSPPSIKLQKTTKPSTDLHATTKPVSSPPSIKLQKTTKPSTDLHVTTKPVSSPPSTNLQKTTKPSTDLHATTKPVSSPPSTNLQKTTKPSTDLHASTKSSTILQKILKPSPSLSLTILQKTTKTSKTVAIYSKNKDCQVETGKIICGQTGISKESCHHAGCCYNASHPTMPCYYSNAATAQCTSDGFFVMAISRDMLDYPIILDKIHFPDPSPACLPSVKTDTFLLFRFLLTQCGTTFRLMGDKLVYETTVSSSIHIQKGPAGSITRDATFALTVRCSYSASDFLPLEVEVFTPPPLPAVTGAGPLHMEMRIARDAQYSSYYTEAEYPVSKVLRDPVYIEVRILHKTDPRLVLVLHQCWAAPTSNPMQGPQWPILVDKCPFPGDNYRTLPVPVGPSLPLQSHYQRFSVATFAFLDSSPSRALMGQVYFFCSASACHPSSLDPCVPGCHSRQRRFLYLQHQAFNESLDLVSSHGPVSFLESEALPEKTQDQSGAVHMSWTLLWSLAAFFMVVAILSVAALCYSCRKSHSRPL
ncbi:zona pellucida sperm-binding protein 1 [Microcaecilia unicolor]|uniref:Zona pellucida sperm-binding protein 1-like n=1 Tax=Microcaecilia unicolor TaxID=1415580 RepID=A0A6P7ZR82_9AMPH|nr:zona pellucida sperm-binding protein 1-like [Microcaecilia unicolor]